MTPNAAKRAAVIDELGQLEQEIAPLEEKKKKAAELKAQIRGWYEKLAPVGTATDHGFKFLMTVGAMENETAIDSMPAVYAALGTGKFLDNCGFTLKKLKELLADKYDKLTTTTRSGSRPVKTFPQTRPK